MATILMVGDEPLLLQTRSDLLRDWHVSTATSDRATEAIRSAAYRLLIICQTIPDSVAQKLIDQAREMNPNVLVLAMSQVDQERNLDVELFEVQLKDPDRLRQVVADLLQKSDRPPHQEPIRNMSH